MGRKHRATDLGTAVRQPSPLMQRRATDMQLKPAPRTSFGVQPAALGGSSSSLLPAATKQMLRISQAAPLAEAQDERTAQLNVEVRRTVYARSAAPEEVAPLPPCVPIAERPVQQSRRSSVLLLGADGQHEAATQWSTGNKVLIGEPKQLGERLALTDDCGGEPLKQVPSAASSADLLIRDSSAVQEQSKGADEERNWVQDGTYKPEEGEDLTFQMEARQEEPFDATLSMGGAWFGQAADSRPPAAVPEPPSSRRQTQTSHTSRSRQLSATAIYAQQVSASEAGRSSGGASEQAIAQPLYPASRRNTTEPLHTPSQRVTAEARDTPSQHANAEPEPARSPSRRMTAEPSSKAVRHAPIESTFAVLRQALSPASPCRQVVTCCEDSLARLQDDEDAGGAADQAEQALQTAWSTVRNPSMSGPLPDERQQGVGSRSGSVLPVSSSAAPQPSRSVSALSLHPLPRLSQTDLPTGMLLP